MYVHYNILCCCDLECYYGGGTICVQGGPNIADTDGPGGPLIPNIDGPGGPLIGETVSSMTVRLSTVSVSWRVVEEHTSNVVYVRVHIIYNLVAFFFDLPKFLASFAFNNNVVQSLHLFLVILIISSLSPVPLSLHTIEFDIQPPLGPDMPLILLQGADRTISCSHRTIPAFAVNWYRDTTALREDIAGGNADCSCNVPSVDPQDQSITVKELIFTDFAASSAGGYDCRVPMVLEMFNICRFDVMVAGKKLV